MKVTLAIFSGPGVDTGNELILKINFSVNFFCSVYLLHESVLLGMELALVNEMHSLRWVHVSEKSPKDPGSCG